jgi:ribonuclease-3
MNDALEAIESAAGHRFSDRALLVTALTPASSASEHPDAESYERLEFLGDAVLELVTTQMIYDAAPDAGEGEMTKLRASMVDESTLAAVADGWDVADALRLGIGEDRSGGRERPSILADAVESLIAAVYVDAGYEAAAAVVHRTWKPILAARLERADMRDPRSALQEVLAQTGREVTFEFHRTGPDHDVEFTATALVDGRAIGRGVAGSKKGAAIEAARDALADDPFDL